MKIKVWCDNGANAYSERIETIDLQKDWGITDEEWNAMTEDEKMKFVLDWANNFLDIGFEPVEQHNCPKRIEQSSLWFFDYFCHLVICTICQVFDKMIALLS